MSWAGQARKAHPTEYGTDGTQMQFSEDPREEEQAAETDRWVGPAERGSWTAGHGDCALEPRSLQPPAFICLQTRLGRISDA
ncbi:unnamed protein product [Cutaneotrichosporon oleaginosum]